jgi:branched-subunit amino acid transport protein AzlD
VLAILVIYTYFKKNKRASLVGITTLVSLMIIAITPVQLGIIAVRIRIQLMMAQYKGRNMS